jgi:hypothetical protein
MCSTMFLLNIVLFYFNFVVVVSSFFDEFIIWIKPYEKRRDDNMGTLFCTSGNYI